MDVRKQLVERIDAYLSATGLSEAAFGKAAVADSRLVSRLKEGKSTLTTIERAIAFINANPPAANEVGPISVRVA